MLDYLADLLACWILQLRLTDLEMGEFCLNLKEKHRDKFFIYKLNKKVFFNYNTAMEIYK